MVFPYSTAVNQRVGMLLEKKQPLLLLFTQFIEHLTTIRYSKYNIIHYVATVCDFLLYTAVTTLIYRHALLLFSTTLIG